MIGRIWLALAALLIATVGTAWCYRPVPPRTVAWFEAHPRDMMLRKTWCDQNPGLADRQPECAAAVEAWFQNSATNYINQAMKKHIGDPP